MMAPGPQGLTLTNLGGFLPGNVETVIEQDAPLEVYRNPFLAEAMVNLNMIDTQGGGIKRMFEAQRRRFFPLPDYDLGQSDRVMVHLQGRILDEAYTRLLMARTDLSLSTIMLLDRVQKHQPIGPEGNRQLRAQKLVEGRYPNLMVSGAISATTGEKARHIRDRGLETTFYLNLVLELIKEFQPVSREEIDLLLLDKLPEVLSETQKRNKIRNLIQRLAKEGRITNAGSRAKPQWRFL